MDGGKQLGQPTRNAVQNGVVVRAEVVRMESRGGGEGDGHDFGRSLQGSEEAATQRRLVFVNADDRVRFRQILFYRSRRIGVPRRRQGCTVRVR